MAALGRFMDFDVRSNVGIGRPAGPGEGCGPGPGRRPHQKPGIRDMGHGLTHKCPLEAFDYLKCTNPPGISSPEPRTSPVPVFRACDRVGYRQSCRPSTELWIIYRFMDHLQS